MKPQGEPAATGTNPRRLAHALLVRVEATDAFADRVLDATLKKSDIQPQDKALVTELVYGALRHLDTLDARLNTLLSKPLITLPGPVRAALRLGAYQLMMMRVPAYSAVNESVKLIGKKYGALLGVVNGVLRRLARELDAQAPSGLGSHNQQGQQKALSVQASVDAHPPWLQQQIRQVLNDDEAEALMVANMTRPQVTIRVNTTRTSSAALQSRLKDAGITAQPSAYCADSLVLPPAGPVHLLPGFDDGHLAVQDGAATLVGHLLAPPRRSIVVDMCSAPGGKAMHAAALMDNTGHIVALDVHPGRLQLVSRNQARLGHANITPVLADMSTAEGVATLRGVLAGRRVSHVVLDAPCSALGTLRRHPELRRRDGANVPALAILQSTLLDVAASLLAEGGVLVYAVCTLTAAEGPDQIAAFLRRHPNFEVTPPPDALAAVREGPYLRTWPHRHSLDGFFAARLVRRATILRQPGAIP